MWCIWKGLNSVSALSNSNPHLFWLLQFIWTVFTISSPSSIIRQTTLIGSLLFFTAFRSRINARPKLFMEWAFCMRCLCQGSVNSHSAHAVHVQPDNRDPAIDEEGEKGKTHARHHLLHVMSLENPPHKLEEAIRQTAFYWVRKAIRIGIQSFSRWAG